MSRDYSKVAPQFWTGPTGKALRAAGPEALVVGCYFMTCPSANMIGLYYLPLPMLCHETGIPLEGASKVLRRVSATGFAHYDDETETVWVPEMARFQISDTLTPKDNLIKGVVRELSVVRKCRFSQDFYEKYRVPFNLPELSWWDEEVEGLPRAFQGPSKGLRSQEQEQEHEQEQEEANNGSSGADAPGASGSTPPLEQQQPSGLHHSGEQHPKQKGRKRDPLPADDAWLALMKSLPIYAGLNVDLELGKLDAWLLTPRGRGKKKTRGRIVYWLNTAAEDQHAVAPQAGAPGAGNVVPLMTPAQIAIMRAARYS